MNTLVYLRTEIARAYTLIRNHVFPDILRGYSRAYFRKLHSHTNSIQWMASNDTSNATKSTSGEISQPSQKVLLLPRRHRSATVQVPETHVQWKYEGCSEDKRHVKTDARLHCGSEWVSRSETHQGSFSQLPTTISTGYVKSCCWPSFML